MIIYGYGKGGVLWGGVWSDIMLSRMDNKFIDRCGLNYLYLVFIYIFLMIKIKI